MRLNTMRLLAATVLLTATTFALDPPAVQWLGTFPKGVRTEGGWVAQTSDHGYIAAGTWRPDDESFDFYLLKTDSLGNLQWDRAIGVGPVAWVWSGALAKDGGYVLVGQKQDRSHAWGLLVKTDSLGTVQWSRGLEADTTPHEMAAFSVVQTLDAGFVVAAFNVGEGLYLVKVDSLGNTDWEVAFRGGYRLRYFPHLLPVRQTVDSGFIIGTLQDSVLRLMKTDSLGSLLWERSYPGLGVREGISVLQAVDRGYVATGVAHAPPESDGGDAYLVKTDSLGNFQWKRTYGGAKADHGRWVAQTSDGGYVLAGCTNVTGAEHIGDGYVVRTDSVGNLMWEKVIGGPGVEDDARCVQQTADGGFVVTGWMEFGGDQGSFYQGHLYILKLAPEGDSK